MSFKIWSDDTPAYLTRALPLFKGGASFTNIELANVTSGVGITDSRKRIEHLTKSWYTLGILDRVKDSNHSFHYSLSPFGTSLLQQLPFNPAQVIDLLHWSWYSGCLRQPNPEWGWSWLYQEVCNTMWEKSPGPVQQRQLLAYASERANTLFAKQSPSFDIPSIRSVTTWLAALEPPFLLKKDGEDPGSRYVSRKRERCSPELLFLALQLQYDLKGLPLGTPLLIDEPLIEAVCKLCLLAPEQFWPMVDVCSLTFKTLARKETIYGTSLMVIEPAPFTPPKLRSAQPAAKK